MITSIIILAVLLVATIVFFTVKLNGLKKNIEAKKELNEIAVQKAIDLTTELNYKRKLQIGVLERTTPRFSINLKNEAVLFSPDEKIEIYNYDLTTKKTK